MRFKEFLNEGLDISAQLKSDIHTNCKQFLLDSQWHGFLYRGIGSLKGKEAGEVFEGDSFSGSPYYKINVRKDRKPLTMPLTITQAADDYFEDEFGVRPRTQAVFCYGEGGRGLANAYGSNLCAIFPIGNFKCIWSPEVADLYDAFSNYHSTHDKDPEDVAEWLSAFNYRDDDFDDAVVKNKELMIVCDSYYAIPAKLTIAGKLKHDLGFK